VNYSQDLRLNDVGFATDDIGWVAGDAGSILYTNDAARPGRRSLAATRRIRRRTSSPQVGYAISRVIGPETFCRSEDNQRRRHLDGMAHRE
jgi:hypothetical protein